MNNLIQEQVEHYLKTKNKIQGQIMLFCKRSALINRDKYFLERLKLFWGT
jgi:GTP-binding protein EngB required for normal cell division